MTTGGYGNAPLISLLSGCDNAHRLGSHFHHIVNLPTNLFK